MSSFQVLSLPFQTGQDEGVHPDYVQPGTQTSIINGRFIKRGALHKRFGYVSTNPRMLNVSGGLSQASRLLSFKGQLLVIGTQGGGVHAANDSIFVRDPTSDGWAYIDKVPAPKATWAGLPTPTDNTPWTDLAYANGYICRIFLTETQSAGVYAVVATITDAVTGSVVLGPYYLTDGSTNIMSPRVVAVGNRFVVTYLGGAATANVYGRLIDTSTIPLAWSGETLLAADNNGVFMDLTAVPGTTWASCAYEVAGGAADIKQRTLDVSTGAFVAVSTQQYTEVGAGVLCIGIKAVSATQCWICYSISGTGLLKAISFSPTTGTANYQNVTALNSGGADYVSASVETNGNAQALMIASTSVTFVTSWIQIIAANPGTLVGLQRNAQKAILMSKPFTYGARIYAKLDYLYTHTTVGFQQPTQFIVDLLQEDTASSTTYALGRPVATIAPRSSTPPQTSAAVPDPQTPSVISTSTGMFRTIGSVMTSGFGKRGLLDITLDFTFTATFPSAEVGNGLYIGGGIPSLFDGVALYETGFTLYPDTVTLTDDGAGGNLSAGTYQYKAVAEWWTAGGERMLSAPSAAASKVLGANHKMKATIRCVNLTAKQDLATLFIPAISLLLYRTLVDQTTFYRLTPVSVPAANWNNPQNATVVNIADNLADTSLTSNETIYTDSGVVPNMCPPSLVHMIAHKNRIWGIDGSLRTIWYTKTHQPNETANFADELTVSFEEGDMTALASMDEALYIFTADRIYFFIGDGALDNGAQSQLDGPTRIVSDVGCIDWRSIVLTPAGIMFRSRVGIYLLSRSREVSYIGKPVEDTLASYPIIACAHQLPYANEVRFVARDVDDGDASRHSVLLVYNYLFQAWTVHQFNFGGSTYTAPFPVVCAAVANDSTGNPNYYVMTADGNVYQETKGVGSASYKDAGTWVSLSVETCHANLSGVEGYQRSSRVLVKMERPDSRSGHHGSNVTVSLGYDFDTSYTDSVTVDTTNLFTNTGARDDLEVKVGRLGTRSPAIRVKISDAQSTWNTTGQGPVLLGVGLEMRQRQGTNRNIPIGAKG